MLQSYIFAMFMWFNLVTAEIEIIPPFVESPSLSYALSPSAPFLSNALQSPFSENGFITGSLPSQFTNNEYKLPREAYETALGNEALILPVSNYGIGSVVQPSVINEVSTHILPVAQGFILQQPIAEAVANPGLSSATSNSYISSTLHPTGGSTYIQPLPLQSYLQEEQFISDATNRDFSGTFSSPPYGYVSLTGSPILQSITGRSTYLQSATRQGYQPVISTAPNPVIELFVKSLTQALTSNELLKDFVGFELQNPGELIHSVGHAILSASGISNPALVESVVQVGNSIRKLDTLVYLDAQTRTAAKFLDTKGLLSIDDVNNLSQSFISFVENRANSKAVVDIESFASAIALGFFDFLKSLGFEDPHEEVFKLFSEELKASYLNAASL